MSAYVIGALAGPFIGLAVGLAVARLDPDGYLRQRAAARAEARPTTTTGESQ